MNKTEIDRVVDGIFESVKPVSTATQEIAIDKIDNFEGHPFKVLKDDSMNELVESIKANGVLYPAIVRKNENGNYEMISGHRRKMACQILGLETMPVLVREMTNEQAIIAMVDSNVQRENICPSEKAFAYKMKLDAIKKQAGRPKDNSVQVGQNFKGSVSRDLLAQNSKDSSVQIQRYIRLTELVPEILHMVDEKKIAFNPAVEISHLSKMEQQDLLKTIESEDCTPSLAQAQNLKILSQQGRLNPDVIFELLTQQKPNQKEYLKLDLNSLRKYFPKNYTPVQMQEVMMKLLADWEKKRNAQNRDSR